MGYGPPSKLLTRHRRTGDAGSVMNGNYLTALARRLGATLIIVALLTAIGLAALPARAWAAGPPEEADRTASPGGPQGPSPYPYYSPGPVGDGGLAGWFSDIAGTFGKMRNCFDDMVQCWLNLIIGVLKVVFAPFIDLMDFVFGDLLAHTGKEITIDAPFVRGMMALSQGIALALLAIVLMWGGFAIMANRQLGSPYHEAMELLPRAAVAVGLIIIFPHLTSLFIDLNNALINAVLTPDEIRQTTRELLNSLGLAPLVLFWAAFLILGVFLAGQLLMRFIILDLLIVTAPITFVLWVLPQTRRWSDLWSGLFPATVFQQAVQAWTLVLGFRIVNIVWQESGGTPGVFTGQAGLPLVITALAAIAVLLAALKVPDLLERSVGYWQPGYSPILATVNTVRGALSSGRSAAAGSAGR